MSAEEAFMCITQSRTRITQSRTRIEKGRLALVVRVNEPPETPWWEGTKAFFAEAAFQIGNAVADEIPYVGQVKGGAELAAGQNVRGDKLGRFDRAMAGLNMVPGGGLVGRVLKGGKVAIGGAIAGGRAVIRRLSRVTAKNADKADEVVDVVRASSGGGRARAPSGSRSLSPVAPRRLVDRQGLNYDLKHLNKHLPDTPEAQRLIRRDGSAHVFKDKETLARVEQAIMERGEDLGTVRGWERWGLKFDEPIGFRIDADGNRIPLFYGELKLNPQTGAYHLVPRTRPAT